MLDLERELQKVQKQFLETLGESQVCPRHFKSLLPLLILPRELNVPRCVTTVIQTLDQKLSICSWLLFCYYVPLYMLRGRTRSCFTCEAVLKCLLSRAFFKAWPLTLCAQAFSSVRWLRYLGTLCVERDIFFLFSFGLQRSVSDLLGKVEETRWRWRRDEGERRSRMLGARQGLVGEASFLACKVRRSSTVVGAGPLLLSLFL